MVDVVVPVSLEPGRVEQNARVRTQRTQVFSIFSNDERAPSPSILRGLIFQALTDLIQATRTHTRDMLSYAFGVLQRQSDGKCRDKVHVADIDEELPRVERELAEGKVGVDVRI